ncbi:MAG TPA: hypothetical protein VK112_01445 [Fodinibius sp.]|nr:hypothetical protein [Fodinibius sp.]
MEDGAMFDTPQEEINEMLVSMGPLTIGDDSLTIQNYPFEPSIAYQQAIFRAAEIEDIDIKSSPPTIKINNELIFLDAGKKDELQKFATTNNIKTVERPPIWAWILEPFLDTEFTAETDRRLTKLLAEYSLTTDQVKMLREEVKTQMLKYNFDTMIWEWVSLGTLDVLKAMRPKYDKEQFNDFYQRVMKIALLSKTTGK